MSASYAKSFGSGAREQTQNLWDQCRVTVPDRQLAINRIKAAIVAEIAGRHHLMADAKALCCSRPGMTARDLIRCTDKAGQQHLFLMNYGAQMTLDNLILGESTKRQDEALAGMYNSFRLQQLLQLPVCGAVDCLFQQLNNHSSS
ncbi:TPA: hypothetical protein ACH3X1_006081 [Trebouxia sp. C0004]